MFLLNLLMYYPSTSQSGFPTAEENDQTTFKSMMQLHTEASCIFETLDMKSTSWIGTRDKARKV